MVDSVTRTLDRVTILSKPPPKSRPLKRIGTSFINADYAMAKGAAEYILSHCKEKPSIGIICGAVLGGISEILEDAVSIPYDNIDGFPTSTVKGHQGKLGIGSIDGVPTLVMKGRLHFYEGFSMSEITFPVRVMKLVGIHILIVSNAAGGLNPGFRVGDIMILNDHICIPGLAGNNPLMGINEDRFGVRFVNMTDVYDVEFRRLSRIAAGEAGMTDYLREGTYGMVAGPSYETPAELRLYRILGADAISMCSAPEVIVARQLGLRILSFSLITNKAVTELNDSKEGVTYDVIKETAKLREPQIKTFIAVLIKKYLKSYA